MALQGQAETLFWSSKQQGPIGCQPRKKERRRRCKTSPFFLWEPGLLRSGKDESFLQKLCAPRKQPFGAKPKRTVLKPNQID